MSAAPHEMFLEGRVPLERPAVPARSVPSYSSDAADAQGIAFFRDQAPMVLRGVAAELGSEKGAGTVLRSILAATKDTYVLYHTLGPDGRICTDLGALPSVIQEALLLGLPHAALCADVLDVPSIAEVLPASPSLFSTTDAATASLPECLLPASQRYLLVAGPGARGPLRRDSLAWCGLDLLLLGRRRWRLLPPSASEQQLKAVVGDLGAAVSPRIADFEEGCWEVIQDPGDLVIVPPGWWYQASPTHASLAVLSHWLPASALPGAAAAVINWATRGEARSMGNTPSLAPIPAALAATAAAPVATAAALRSALASRPNGERPVRSCTLVPPGGLASDDALAHLIEETPYEERLLRLLEKHPKFGVSGIAVPVDADDWPAVALDRLAATDGFLRHRRRGQDGGPTSAPPARRAYLERIFVDVPAPFGGHTSPLSPHDACPPTGVPRVIWIFWHQGAERLPPFRRFCVHSWRLQNPGWQLRVLTARTALKYVAVDELPDVWQEMQSREQAADALRLALLARHGGVWVDSSLLCLQPLDEWLTPCVDRHRLCAFCYERYGRAYVENWFLAARPGHPLICAWRDVFCQAWAGRRGQWAEHRVFESPLFRSVDLSHLSQEKRHYLTMHICLKKLIDEDTQLRRIWAEEMLLLRADDFAMGWMHDVWSALHKNCEDPLTQEMVVQRWVFERDDAWVDQLAQRAQVLKFIGKFCWPLDAQPREHLFERNNCLGRALAYACRSPDMPPRGPGPPPKRVARMPVESGAAAAPGTPEGQADRHSLCSAGSVAVNSGHVGVGDSGAHSAGQAKPVPAG